jgi:FdhD protein
VYGITLAGVSDDLDDDERIVACERGVWIDGNSAAPELDLLAREEPLEIRVNQVALAVVMRTPGNDEELVRGFLLSERIAATVADIADLRHCDKVEAPEAEDNVMLVRLAENVDVDLAALHRNLYASSSCGVCGKSSIEVALALPSFEGRRSPDVHVAADVLTGLPERLRAEQLVFARTGGLHGVGLFDCDGRHNAVDKVIGWASARAIALDRCVLMVSGRVSFEIVQKALALAIPIIAAVSAPTSLAVELARAAGMTLVGFVRDNRLCVYTGAQRLLARGDKHPA